MNRNISCGSVGEINKHPEHTLNLTGKTASFMPTLIIDILITLMCFCILFCVCILLCEGVFGSRQWSHSSIMYATDVLTLLGSRCVMFLFVGYK